jgi:hypothetical protein
VTAVLLFPDVTALVTTYLRSVLPVGVSVGTRVPNPCPLKLVTVRRSGGVREALVTDAAQITLWCFAESEEEAFDLASLCRSKIHALRGTVQSGSTVYKVDELQGPVEEPDDLTNKPRYTYTAIIFVRGAPAT